MGSEELQHTCPWLARRAYEVCYDPSRELTVPERVLRASLFLFSMLATIWSITCSLDLVELVLKLPMGKLAPSPQDTIIPSVATVFFYMLLVVGATLMGRALGFVRCFTRRRGEPGHLSSGTMMMIVMAQILMPWPVESWLLKDVCMVLLVAGLVLVAQEEGMLTPAHSDTCMPCITGALLMVFEMVTRDTNLIKPTVGGKWALFLGSISWYGGVYLITPYLYFWRRCRREAPVCPYSGCCEPLIIPGSKLSLCDVATAV